MTDSNPKSFKLFPRNLTARAAAVVRGNPVTSRPESGVENDFPGLELDHRNLDKVFFPGLIFELHHHLAVVLRSIAPGHVAASFWSEQEVREGVYLLYLRGHFASRTRGVAPQPRIFRLAEPAGLDSWRLIRDLERGSLGIALCDRRARETVLSETFNDAFAESWFDDQTDRVIDLGRLGKVVMLFAERTRYLTDDGVIDPAILAPGDLTRSLCSPWQFDFADCGCFYWASNKPDLVSSAEQPDQVLNFQRKDRSASGDGAATSDDWLLKYDRAWDGPQLTMRHSEMIQRWSELPFVIGGRETTRYEPQVDASVSPLLPRATIISRLRSLAGVEHALAVEYLYAYHSLAIPAERPVTGDSASARVWTAGEHVFQVAIDEMRHLRSVNEMLIELGEPAVVARATIIGEDYDKNGKAFERPFELQPLTFAQLDWFIAVEAASQNASGDQTTLDGMYTLVLRSIVHSEDFEPDAKQRLVQLIKTIIDEGIDHYERFSAARRALSGLSEGQFLRVSSTPLAAPAGSVDRLLQDTADAAYVVVLRALEYAFRLGDQQRGAMLEAARRAMFNLDDAARALAVRGVGVLYTLVPDPSALLDVQTTRSARSVGEPLRKQLAMLAGSDEPQLQELAGRLSGRLAQLTRDLEALTGS